MFTNFKHYELMIPDIVRVDVSCSPIRQCEIFDAVVCDPPYGKTAKVATIRSQSWDKARRKERRERSQESNGILRRNVMVMSNEWVGNKLIFLQQDSMKALAYTQIC